MKKTLLILSYWEYPFGGGEEYLYQTAGWCHGVGMQVYWLSFSNAKNVNHTTLKITNGDFYTAINVPGGYTETTLTNWITLLKPDIIHHQGHFRKEFYQASEKSRTEFISGIHFWSGIIDLDPKTSNICILKNSHRHGPSRDFEELKTAKYLTFYSVSDFVTDCVAEICGYKLDVTCYSGSSISKCLVPNMNPMINKYVSMVNIHKLKGGEILLHCLRQMPEIPFIVVCTEYHSEDLDREIKTEIDTSNSRAEKSIKSIYMNRVSDIRYIYEKTRIFLAASLVDETFCRTVNEAQMNGICVLTSGRGNLGYMIDDPKYIIDPDKPDDWVATIKEYYYNQDKLRDAFEYSRTRYQKYSEKIGKRSHLELIYSRLKKGKSNSVMLYCPWCDQGLGIQARNYYNILTNGDNFRVSVFSYKPYNSRSCIELQKNPQEWKIDNVYYSSNDRESVTDIEIINFVQKYNIGICILPETCWFRTFEIAKLLRDLSVKCYAIPNIEIVRKDEIHKHTYFHKILCNNHLCEKIFNSHGINNTQYIGYAIESNDIHCTIPISGITANKTENINFLFIGGMNAFSRKHIVEICQAFDIAYKRTNKIRLTCTIQMTNQLETTSQELISPYLDHSGITFIQKHLTYHDIMKLYHTHHVSVQVSKHEGLGLGFYEALSTATPVISLNTPPHNEIIKPGINGWLISCYYKPMTDNPNGLIESAYFDSNALADKMCEIAFNPEILRDIVSTLTNDYIENFTSGIFMERLMTSISD